MSDEPNKAKIDDSAERIKVYDDVPRNEIVVRSAADAKQTLVRLRGDSLPNECIFCCIMCGWEGNLRFDADEIEALGGNVEYYSGPCSGFEKDAKGQFVYEKDADGAILLDAQGNQVKVPCQQMALLPKTRMGSEAFVPGEQVAKREKLRQMREAAEVNADVLVEKVTEAFASSVAAAVAPPAPQAPVQDTPKTE